IHQNTSGETKASVYKRIGAVVLPEFHEIDPTATGDRVKGKLESLSEGLRESQDSDNGDPTNEFCQFYIGANGPDATSTEEAKNLWEEIKNDFPFFADLHQIFAARPNVTPIAVTTGVGPHGKKTFHMQPPSDDEDNTTFTASQVSQIRTLQDALNHANTAPRAASPSFEFVNDKENTPFFHAMMSSQTPIRTKAPKPSSMSQDSITKVKGRIQKITPKRSIEDTLFEIQRVNLNAMNARAREELLLKKRNCLLEEFKAGIWDAAEY
ncbi:hypothetical protein DEU56DRAFT_746050, partial [Suillus clintonianus]|uniref:uncharacterized protein n=1 Tax=Suillus clintonianus TaxID=1904413 RepID=UPI001B86CA07